MVAHVKECVHCDIIGQEWDGVWMIKIFRKYWGSYGKKDGPICHNCSCCKKELPATSEYFHKHSKEPLGLRYICKVCRATKQQNNNIHKNRYKKNRDEMKKGAKEWYYENKDRKRAYDLKRNYNITIEEYNEMLNKYDGKCWICGTHQAKLKRKLSIDHNHKTGKIRGLLCDSCNGGIGHMKENYFILIKSIKYLKGELI